MPVNRNALIRYRTIDECLRNRRRPWTLDDLIDACSDALYEYEGIEKGVSRRTVQADIETMRSGKLGYEAPIVVIDKRYYTYSDNTFSIRNNPLTAQDLVVLAEASSLLQQFVGLRHAADVDEMVTRLEDKIHSQRTRSPQLVVFERNEHLRGLHWIEVLRRFVIANECCTITYQSFRARHSSTFAFSPYLLKEYRNRWFMLGTSHQQRPVLQTLALDRIEDVTENTDARHSYIPNTTIDLNTYYDHMIGVTRDITSEPVTVVLRADRRTAPYIATKPLHASQTAERDAEGGMVFTLQVILNPELEREILSFGPGLEVLRPRILRKHVAEAIRAAAQVYEQE